MKRDLASWALVPVWAAAPRRFSTWACILGDGDGPLVVHGSEWSAASSLAVRER